MQTSSRLLGALGILLFALPTLAALELIRPTSDGGGGTSSAETLSLTGTVGQPDAGAASGDTLELMGGFWAGDSSGVTAVEPEIAVRVNRLHAAAPNPFNPATTIRFELAEPGPASVRIYSIAGRLVRELVADALAAGSHDLVWNGRDDGGHGVASGTYLVQMRARGFAAVRKVTLVK